MNRKRLTAQLKPEHRQAGFYLEEDEDCLYLMREGEIVARWLSTNPNTTIEAVLEETDRQMAKVKE